MNKYEAASFYGNYSELLRELRELELSEKVADTFHNDNFYLESQSSKRYNNINRERKGIANSEEISILI